MFMKRYNLDLKVFAEISSLNICEDGGRGEVFVTA